MDVSMCHHYTLLHDCLSSCTNFLYSFSAVVYDSARVFGYTAWSLVDGFEWNFGYSVRRGLFYVDFNDTDRNRIPKTSAKFYRQVVMNSGFNEISESINGQFPCDFQWGVADPVLHVSTNVREYIFARKYLFFASVFYKELDESEILL